MGLQDRQINEEIALHRRLGDFGPDVFQSDLFIRFGVKINQPHTVFFCHLSDARPLVTSRCGRAHFLVHYGSFSDCDVGAPSVTEDWKEVSSYGRGGYASERRKGFLATP